ncbi:hypothetical protein HII31_06902 [Pseudocercospora fuligena]|uniref:Mid2 domain-containing protein n=1 Tax=Pseudocercospora fuligena TaxID=685502 RepID=A0A8H6RJS3_9PEZI|nr:hypothetical protein HII31_06902 [Pseudocercospora fuligena]
MLLRSIAFLWILVRNVAADCYLNNGVSASSYNACPGEGFCCESTAQCATNGMCFDPANKPDGSNITFGGSRNLTGLYQMPGCVNQSLDGCVQSCPLLDSGTYLSYIWACNDELTEYCCVGEFGQNIYNFRSCCKDGNNFRAEPGLRMNVVDNNTAATTSAASASTSGTASSATSSAASSNSSASSNRDNASEGLSTGAKAGIGVGVAGGAILAFALFFWLWRRRSSRQRIPLGQNNEQYVPPQEIEASPAEKNELASKNQNWLAEAPTYREPAELLDDGGGRRYAELDASG